MFKNKDLFPVSAGWARAGFTLIELLVVIAVIGILSSIVLGSLNIARGKASDAKVKAQITGAKNSAEIFNDINKSYNGIAGDVSYDCATAESMFQDPSSGMDQYTDQNNYPPATTLRCSSTDSTYVISASLQDSGQFWCVDSNGAAKQIAADTHELAHPDGATECPAS